jgi:hypothetical protein
LRHAEAKRHVSRDSAPPGENPVNSLARDAEPIGGGTHLEPIRHEELVAKDGARMLRLESRRPGHGDDVRLIVSLLVVLPTYLPV